jgi:hypothetical protein
MLLCVARENILNKERPMSNPLRSIALSGLLLFAFCTASVASAAYADPRERVARLSHIQGGMSDSPSRAQASD